MPTFLEHFNKYLDKQNDDTKIIEVIDAKEYTWKQALSRMFENVPPHFDVKKIEKSKADILKKIKTTPPGHHIVLTKENEQDIKKLFNSLIKTACEELLDDKGLKKDFPPQLIPACADPEMAK